MAKDHFVPRHYLRQFAVNGATEMVVTAQISPFRLIGEKGIGGQCQQIDFEEGDKRLAETLKVSENDLAPVLVDVVRNEDFSVPQSVALRFLASILHVRTRKAAEKAKLFPKRIFFEVIKGGIEKRGLPLPPEGKWTEDMVACTGAPGFQMQIVLPLWLEMQTLACKMLKSPGDPFFVTSDDPVVVLNQFAASAEPLRSFTGFSKSGFQLLLPISPNLCLMFYDAKIYKLGSPRHRLIRISKDDVDLVNSFQVQSAENCIYFHDPAQKPYVEALINRYAKLRRPIQDSLRTYSARNGDKIFHLRQSSVKLTQPWTFCRLRRDIKFEVGDRRNPAWSGLIDAVMQDVLKNPNGGDIHTRIHRIINDPNSLR